MRELSRFNRAGERALQTETRFVPLLLVIACGGTPSDPAGSSSQGLTDLTGDVKAYYDGDLFTIFLKEQPVNAEATLIAHNGSINTIWESDAVVDGTPFVPVLDAIQGDGFNPLWREVVITFNVAPFQLTKDDDIAAAAATGQITLHVTNEMYICAVIGRKK